MMSKFFNNKFIILYLAPFILGLLSVLSFQPFNLTIINFFLLPAYFLILVYVNKKSKSIYRKKPFLINFFIAGLTFGYGFFLSGIYWISHSLTFDENFRYLIPFAIFLIPLFLCLFTGITTLIIGRYLNYNFPSLLLFSASFALTDYLRSKILTGFPWNLWSYSLSWLTELLQILNLIGLFAFNLLIITIFTIPAIIFFKTNFSNKIIIFSSTLLTIFSIYIYGTYEINKNKSLLNYIEDKNKIYFKVISPDFDLKYNLSIKEVETQLKRLIKLSDPDSKQKTIFIWPEGISTGYSYDDIFIFKDLFINNFNDKHKIIFGINTLDPSTDAYFNSFVVVNNRFEILYKYNKRKLVPFGEFLPFENSLNKAGFKKITQGRGSFSKGNLQKNYNLDYLSILPLICYEIIFPSLTQKANNKTNLIINISEDGWFGNTYGPYQHFAKAIFRSIENNSYLLRSANKGISAIINNKGQIIKKLNVGEAGNIEIKVPILKESQKNKNDLIFFVLLITYLIIFLIFKKKR